jgi:hypothetical protein
MPSSGSLRRSSSQELSVVSKLTSELVTATVQCVRLVRFAQYDNGGILTVYPTGDDAVPFFIKRVFSIADVPTGGKRADHAHRRCTQLHVCVTGQVTMYLKDGTSRRRVTLTSNGVGAMVPPLIWNRLVFDRPGTALIVICDEPYDDADYIRDWREFQQLKGAGAKRRIIEAEHEGADEAVRLHI